MSGRIVKDGLEVAIIGPDEVVKSETSYGNVEITGREEGFVSTVKDIHIFHWPGGLFSKLKLRDGSVVFATKDEAV